MKRFILAACAVFILAGCYTVRPMRVPVTARDSVNFHADSLAWAAAAKRDTVNVQARGCFFGVFIVVVLGIVLLSMVPWS
jgi:hypothetical protein